MNQLKFWLKKWRVIIANKWFFHQIFSYLPLFILILAFIFTSFLQSYSQRNQKEIEMVSAYINQSIKQTIDNNLKSIYRQTSNELIVNNAVMQFFTANGKQDDIIKYNVMGKLQEIKDMYPLIDSIYAVRFSDHILISETIISDAAHHGDEAFIRQHESVPYSSGWSSIRETSFSEPVVSLIRKVNPNTPDGGMLVVNISVSKMHSLVEDLVGTNFPYVEIIDHYGKAIVGESGNSNDPVLAEIHSDYTGWVYIIKWFDKKAPLIFDTIPKLWLLVMVIASSAGIVGVVYVSYRNYRPVKAITSLINEFTRKESIRITEHANEIKYIETAMHTLIDNSLQTQELLETEKIMKQRSYFLDILDNNAFTPQTWECSHNKLNNLPFHGDFVVIVLEIDRYDRFIEAYSQRDQDLLKYVLRSMVQEIFMENQLPSWAEWTEARRLTCIIAYPAHSGKDEEVHGIYTEVLEWVHQYLHFTITIGIGPFVRQADNIQFSANAAKTALNYKAVFGNNRLICTGDYAHAQMVPLNKYYTRAKAVAAALRSSRQEQHDKLHAMFSEMRNQLVDNGSLLQVMQYFIIQLEQELSVMLGDYLEVWQSIRDNLSMSGIESVEEAESTIQAMMDSIFHYMESVRENRLHRIQIDQIRKYVEQNYANQDLSLDLLSSHFGLSSKYISKLFKDGFGVNFTDFVIDLRMEYASKLLIETDRPIQDIAEGSGYSSSIAFRRTFKKITGLTPGEFRLQKRG